LLALDGDAAIAEGVRLSRPQIVAAYPITPQTPIVERVADFIAAGDLSPARYLAVESEHSALSAVVGAALVGARVFTATAGAGLALMHEIVGVAAGNRLPIVMAIANRALPSPWSLQCDHSDSMAERDMGWIQLYAESSQEGLDLIILGYRLAEQVRLPVMVCIDGFFVSHSTEVVSVPDQDDVDSYLPRYSRGDVYLDPENPMTINQLSSPDVFTEMKRVHKQALDNALALLPGLGADYGRRFGRAYGSILADSCTGADVVLVALGSAAGTARKVAADLRGQGQRVGVLRITSFRPFPSAEVCAALKGCKGVAVIDRSWGLGSDGPLALEVKAALYGLDRPPAIHTFVAGLGGRDLTENTIGKAFDAVFAGLASGVEPQGPTWLDLKDGD
jgi:pyruvate ferredoxin oxidoreductase alpha subunit